MEDGEATPGLGVEQGGAAPKFEGSAKKGERRNPSGKKKGPPVELVARDGETQLEAMRWILANQTDQTPLQWQMRQWLLRNPDKFMDAKMALERTLGPNPGPSTPTNSAASSTSDTSNSVPPSVAPDLGTERCLELVEELIRRYERPK